MTETELKFEVPPAAARAIESRLRALDAGRSALESRYFDSEQGHLARAGVSLRLRRTGARWEQTVKALGQHAVARLEETVPLSGRFRPGGPLVDPMRHAGTQAGEVLADVLRRSAAEGCGLLEVYRSKVVRCAVTLQVDGARIEVAFDRGRLVAGDRKRSLCELEYELKAGEPADLIAFARAAIPAHGVWLSTLSKAARGQALAGDEAFAATKAEAPPLRRGLDAAALRQAVIGACLDQVLANASVLAAGHKDDDVIHQLRVGLRRLRTAARELRTSGGEATWEAVVADVFRALGDYRDGATVAAALGAELAAAGAPTPVLRPVVEPVDPVTLVRGADFQHALLDVLRESMSGETGTGADGPGGDGDDVVGHRLDRLHAALRKGARRFHRLDEAGQHRVRKRLKRLRYLAELVSVLHGDRAVERYLDALRPAQDALGHYLDVVVGIRLARGRGEAGEAHAWFNVGWLSAQLPDGVKRCRKALRQAAAARPFWHHAGR